jgi:hypothetical protein
MKISIHIDKDLIINGAENEDFQITLLSVDYY